MATIDELLCANIDYIRIFVRTTNGRKLDTRIFDHEVIDKILRCLVK